MFMAWKKIDGDKQAEHCVNVNISYQPASFFLTLLITTPNPHLICLQPYTKPTYSSDAVRT